MTDAEFLRYIALDYAAPKTHDRLESIAATLDGVRVSVEDARLLLSALHTPDIARSKSGLAASYRLRTAIEQGGEV